MNDNANIKHRPARPPEVKEKIRKANIGKMHRPKKPVLCIETGLIYESAGDASIALHVSRCDICKSCNNYSNTHTAGGYHFKYI